MNSYTSAFVDVVIEARRYAVAFGLGIHPTLMAMQKARMEMAMAIEKVEREMARRNKI